MAAALVYSLMLVAYLHLLESEQLPSPRGLSDVFGKLTFRERYEALMERAGRDSLTELLHRGSFDELGEQMVATSLRTGKALTLLVIDADHFKSINDRFGHSEGDRVLKMIAELLVRAVGTEDKVFRIGGEEFAILCAFPHALGKLLGESIRQSVVAAGRSRATPCSVSIGVATVDARIGSLADLFALADQRLYAAKTGGRDRVVGDGTSERQDQAALQA